jgi:hypothetical protein
MESDGPYKLVGGVFEGPNGFNFRIVWGPDFKLDDKIILEEIIKIANQSYAEGRKAAEKDFKEAIGWADSICLDWNYSKDYKKWKKARGIE